MGSSKQTLRQETEPKYQRERLERRGKNTQNVKRFPHPPPPSESPPPSTSSQHFKATPFHHLHSSSLHCLQRYWDNSPSLHPSIPSFDNKLTAAENGSFQFGCTQSHYFLIAGAARLFACLKVPRLSKLAAEGMETKGKVWRRDLKKKESGEERR